MGNKISEVDAEEFRSYFGEARIGRHPVDIPDKMPSRAELPVLLTRIAKDTNLSAAQEKALLSAQTETQWKLINIYKKYSEKYGELGEKKAEKRTSLCPASYMTRFLQTNLSLKVLQEMRTWLETNANNNEVQSFITFKGMLILLSGLEYSEKRSRKTKNYSRQILLLRTLEFLIKKYECVKENLMQNENAAWIVYSNFNPKIVDLCSLPLEILKEFAKYSKTAFVRLLAALDRKASEGGFRHRFEPMLRTLNESTNIIVVEDVLGFLHALLQPCLNVGDKEALVSELFLNGFKLIVESVMEKIVYQQSYLIDECTYEAYKKDIEKQREQAKQLKSQAPFLEEEDEEIFEIDRGMSKPTYIKRDQDEFDDHLLNIVNMNEDIQKQYDAFVARLKIETAEDEQKIRRLTTVKFLDAQPEQIRDIPAMKLDDLKILSPGSLISEDWLKENFEPGLKLIGKGGFGTVLLGTRITDRKLYAIKTIETMITEDFEDAKRELENLQQLEKHQHVMSFERFAINEVEIGSRTLHQVFIEMQLATSTLDTHLKQTKSRLNEKLIWQVLGQLLQGLTHAHSKGLPHLDLKPENILVVGDIIKITDWGGSLILKSKATTKMKSQAIGVTRGYVAPELDDSEYGSREEYNYYKSDVYSIGMLLLECCGVPYLKIKKVPKGEQSYHEETISKLIYDYLLKHYSSKLIEVVFACTKFDPRRRPTVLELLALYNKLS